MYVINNTYLLTVTCLPSDSYAAHAHTDYMTDNVPKKVLHIGYRYHNVDMLVHPKMLHKYIVTFKLRSDSVPYNR